MTEPQVSLASLGWDDSWAEALPPCPEVDGKMGGCVPGRVTRVDRGLCTVLTADGPVRASLGGDVLERVAVDASAAPCTGDWCLVRHWPDGPVTVEALAERRTRLVRADASRSSHGQVLAANVDVVAVVVALHPEPNLSRIERLLAVAWESGARPVVVLTKSDLVVDAAAVAEDVRVTAPDVPVVCCSTTTRDGVDDVRGLLGTGTMALIGASGHGKSSLANALVGAAVLTTRTIRDDGKGRHTSVRRELLVVPGGGVLIDTPGLRGVGLQHDAGSVSQAFPDIPPLAAQCRFRDCRHDTEPGCAVRAALDEGALSVRRWESWQRLQREAARAEARVDARVRAEQAKRWRDQTKQSRARRHGGRP